MTAEPTTIQSSIGPGPTLDADHFLKPYPCGVTHNSHMGHVTCELDAVPPHPYHRTTITSTQHPGYKATHVLTWRNPNVPSPHDTPGDQ